jgi:LacI family transcriptional regulator
LDGLIIAAGSIGNYLKIAFISGPPVNHDSCERLQAYKEALEEDSITLDRTIIYQGDFSYNSYRSFIASMIADQNLPFDAIVSANDEMALGLMTALKIRGYSAPEDYAIIGFDDINECRIGQPELTTISKL